MWTLLTRFGFDSARLRFTLRTAVAACLAVLIAWLAGLEHPQWSGMTVWAASLPIRGHLLEKSAVRALGTILGAIFGMGLLLASSGQPWIVIIGLALWIGLCAGAGNIVRGFASYGAMLAGYSAAMVTLLHSGQSADPFSVGIDRMLTVLLGVLVALATGWIFATAGESDNPATQVQALSRRIIDDLINHLAASGVTDSDEHHHLLFEMAALEDKLDHYAAGSFSSRAANRAIRRQLSSQVGILLWMRRSARRGGNTRLIAALQEARDRWSEPDPEKSLRLALLRAAGLSADPMLREALSGLAATVEKAKPPLDAAYPALALHRDWIGAREALLRATFVILAVGAVWLLTGWEGGAFMLLGAAIMTTIFSTADNPALTLRQVLLGQTLGVIGALACRWLVWPQAGSELGLILLMMPFILIGGVLFGHSKGAGPLGYDYNMIVLLLLQPVWPLAGDLPHSLTVGAAVILGPAVGLIGFLLVFPVTGERRLRTLIAMMVHEVEAMAASRGVSRRRAIRRARLYHRVLCLVRRADKIGASRQEAVDGAFALLLAGSSVLHINQLLQRPEVKPGAARRLKATLARLRNIADDPWRAARALTATADRLTGVPDIDVDLLKETSAELAKSAAFIRQAAPSGGGPAPQAHASQIVKG